MKKPELIITKKRGLIPYAGICSSCPAIGEFRVGTNQPNREKNEKILNAAFERHFKKVHLTEDASQAAARIVREATKD
jgi:hypothetical protein